MFTFNAPHSLASSYITELVSPYSAARTLRSTDEGLLTFPWSLCKISGDRSFDSSGTVSLRVYAQWSLFSTLKFVVRPTFTPKPFLQRILEMNWILRWHAWMSVYGITSLNRKVSLWHSWITFESEEQTMKLELWSVIYTHSICSITFKSSLTHSTYSVFMSPECVLGSILPLVPS